MTNGRTRFTIMIACSLLPSCWALCPAAETDSYTDRLLSFDAGLVTPETAETAAVRIGEFRERIAETCRTLPQQSLAPCVLREILGPDGLAAVRNDPSVASGLASEVLATGSGSCAGLIGAILAASGDLDPFDAVVLYDHVVLADRFVSGRFFEVLDEGRILTETDLTAKYAKSPIGPVRVSASDFFSFYLDNVAARLHEEGRLETARSILRQALAIEPDSPRFRFNLGALLVGLREFEEARRLLREAIDGGWATADAWASLGVAQLELGDTRQARLSFERAIALAPRHRIAHHHLGALGEESDPRD